MGSICRLVRNFLTTNEDSVPYHKSRVRITDITTASFGPRCDLAFQFVTKVDIRIRILI